MPTKIGLGTVQLGTSYGNRSHLEAMSEYKACDILDLARRVGIHYFDTAAAYGQSEERLGKFLTQTPNETRRVATKIPPTSRNIWTNQKLFRKFVFDSIRRSQARLKTDAIDSVLFHQCDIEFLEHPAVKSTIRDVLNENLCKTFGVSIYEPIQAHSALAIDEISCLQIPLNVLDQRFVSPELSKLYKSRNIEVIARSIFLQGLLVEHAPLPQVKRRAELTYLKGLCIDAARTGFTQSLEDLSLNFAMSQFGDFLDIVILGVHSTEELEKNLAMIRHDTNATKSNITEALKPAQDFAIDSNLINPATWDQ